MALRRIFTISSVVSQPAKVHISWRQADVLSQRNVWRLASRVPSNKSRHETSLNFSNSGTQSDICLLELPLRQPARGYAKGKAKGKDKGGKSKKGKASSVYLSSEELNTVFDFSKMTDHMQLTLTHLKQDYAQQLSLRTSQGAFDSLVVDTPEGQFPLIQLGQVIQKNPQLIVINMATTPQYTANVKQAILDSGMNLNPQQDGISLFVPIPKVTKEHRENLAKSAKTLFEKSKVKIKDIQNKYVKELKKAEKLHSEDLINNLKIAVQDQTHKFTIEAEDIMHAKQKELIGGK